MSSIYNVHLRNLAASQDAGAVDKNAACAGDDEFVYTVYVILRCCVHGDATELLDIPWSQCGPRRFTR